MSLFNKAKYPKLPEGDYNIVIRCSICNGEQVLCLKDNVSGEMRELMLVNDEEELFGFCKQNSISIDEIKKVY